MSKVVVEYTIEGASVCDLALTKYTKGMIAELTVYIALKAIELFVQTLVFQMTQFFSSRLVAWLYDPLRPCG